MTGRIIVFLPLLAQQLYLDFKPPGVWMRTEIVRPEQMNLPAVRARAETFVRLRSDPGIRVARLVLATSKAAAGWGSALPLGPGETIREMARTRSFPFARITSIGKSSVMEFRDEHDRLYREVLTGGDPSLFVLDHRPSCELLHFNAKEAVPPVRFGSSDRLSIEVFFQCSRWVDPEHAKALWDTVSRAFGTRTVVMLAATCVCFDPEQGFPIHFAFQPHSAGAPSARLSAISHQLTYDGIAPSGDRVQRSWPAVP